MRTGKSALYARQAWNQDRTCGWTERRGWRLIEGELKWLPTGEWSYRCWHERACTECGKILDHYPRGKDCPDWKPRDDG
jgi:hypothetical protein